VVVALGVTLGVEIAVAVRRDYLPTAPAMNLGGTFGPRGGKPLRLAVLGDSSAAGVGAGSPAGAYPTRLAERLGSDGYRVELTALGVSGARVATLLSEQVSALEDAPQDLVLVGIGANDVTHATPLEEVGDDMRRVVERLATTGAEVVVAGAPDMRAAAFQEPLRSLSGWRGRHVAAAIAAAGRAAGATVVPLAERTGTEFGRKPALYNSADDFHPSAAGYGLWVDAIYPELKRAASSL